MMEALHQASTSYDEEDPQHSKPTCTRIHTGYPDTYRVPGYIHTCTHTGYPDTYIDTYIQYIVSHYQRSSLHAEGSVMDSEAMG